MRLLSALTTGALVASCSWWATSATASASGVPRLSLGQTSVFSVQGVPVPATDIQGSPIPATPAKYDKVTVRRFGSPSATNVLVLVPGLDAAAGYFDIVGPYLATHVPNLQVWGVDRREDALEDNSVLLRVLNGKESVQNAFEYYLEWLVDKQITNHYQPLANSAYQFRIRVGTRGDHG